MPWSRDKLRLLELHVRCASTSGSAWTRCHGLPGGHSPLPRWRRRVPARVARPGRPDAQRARRYLPSATSLSMFRRASLAALCGREKPRSTGPPRLCAPPQYALRPHDASGPKSGALWTLSPPKTLRLCAIRAERAYGSRLAAPYHGAFPEGLELASVTA
jgi:hypothetical protein